MFAATGDNFLIHDGNWIRVEPFTFTWIPWKKDASGNKVPDLDKMVTYPYDAFAQVDTAWVCENLDKEIRRKILDKKNELFKDGALSNRPGLPDDDDPVANARNSRIPNTPPPPQTPPRFDFND